jgi:hypothetical protein
MRPPVRIIALAAAGALLSQNVVGLAQTATDPIRLDDCRIMNTRSYVSAYKPITLSFTNLRASSADNIRFVVQYAGRTEHITDKGTFAQNVTVTHAFNGFYNSRYVGAALCSCTVEYAHFSDGSTWEVIKTSLRLGDSSVVRC